MIKKLIKKCIGTIGGIMHKTGLLPKDILLVVDGGICSQMHFYLVGEMLRARGNNVIYDLQWFKDNGLDCDGKFCRNFDLLKLFPGLPFPQVRSILHRKLYDWSVPHCNDFFDNDADPFAWLDLRGPLYLTGYFHDPEMMFSDFFPRCFRIDTGILTGTDQELLRKIEGADNRKDCCAVHVRRGDLANYNIAYGNPASTSYFLNAMETVRQFAGNQGKEVRYFIFSDEPAYVTEELLPLMKGYDVELCAGNGSDKGYCDLALISRCRHIVTSQGSLGKYGAMLRPADRSDGMVTLLPNGYSAEWQPRFPNAIVIYRS